MLSRGETSSEEILSSVLNRLRRVEGTLNAYVYVNEDAAVRRARALDSDGHRPRRRRPEPDAATPGRKGVLRGIPIAVKDNICTRGIPTTCASHMLEGYVPPYDATVVKRVEEAGTVLVGKCNLDEFGMGSSTEYSALGVTRNPWDPGRVAGGSSGGAAAAVSAGAAIAALGTDTGGSVRLPASFCGVTGFRPSYGCVSRYGLVAYASSMDQVGFLARDALDCAALMDAVAGPDGLDATAHPGRLEAVLDPHALEGSRVGVPVKWVEQLAAPETRRAFREAIAALERLGAETREIELPEPSFLLSTYYVLAVCEASSNLARYDGALYGARRRGTTYEETAALTRSRCFGREVRRRILLGTFALSAGYHDRYYSRAVLAREAVRGEYQQVLSRVDFIATPTAAGPAFEVGEKTDDPLSMYLEDAFTVGPSLAGLPALSLPMGFTSEGLPLGLQLVGRRFDDYRVLAAGRAYQDATAHHKARPPDRWTRRDRSRQ